jgi:SNF2 family DNA or RNA helicase
MYELKTNPWPHQWAALDYMITHDQAALFTDMGSGKTKIMIDTIVNKNFKRVLIVTTKKSCDVWDKQFDVHSNIAKNLRFKLSDLSTTDKISKVKETFGRGKIFQQILVYIVNYDSVWIEPFSNLVLKLPWDCVICDESHRIKSPSGKASRFLARLGKKVQHRYILTGTPVSEAPTDIYGQYRFLRPDIFGTNFGNFKNLYVNIDQVKSAYCGFPVLDSKNPYKNLDDLNEKMYSCAFYAESSVELPDTTHLIKDIELSKRAVEVYRELVKEGVYEDEQGVVETNNVLTLHTRLQQLLSGYLPMEDETFTDKFQVNLDRTKYAALEELLEEAPPTTPIVVFAKYRHDFDMIKLVCEKQDRRYGEISGQLNNYQEWVDEKIDLIAVQYKSGSESIDLTRSRYCIYYSHTFSYGLYLQSLKRTHRPGQKHRVTYYHIISHVPKLTSVDEKILKAHKMKKNLVDYVREYEKDES